MRQEEFPLIRVSRRSYLNALFETSEKELKSKLSGKELQEHLKLLPSKEEEEFNKIFISKAPELVRIQRKMSICIYAEVSILENNLFEYSYAGKVFRVEGPKNSFIVSRKLELGRHDAVLEMSSQSCILVDGKKDDIVNLDLDELNLLISMIDRFFFLISL